MTGQNSLSSDYHSQTENGRMRSCIRPLFMELRDYLSAQKASEAKWVLSVKSSTTSSQGVLAR